MARNSQKKPEPPVLSPIPSPTSDTEQSAPPAPLASLGQEPSKVPPHPPSDVIQIPEDKTKKPAPGPAPSVTVDKNGTIQIK